MEVDRNFFGRQLQSFEGPLTMLSDIGGIKASKDNADDTFVGVFIRAPAVARVLDDGAVKRLATVVDKRTGENTVVAVQQGDVLLGTAFHPELTKDNRWHEHFLTMVSSRKGGSA